MNNLLFKTGKIFLHYHLEKRRLLPVLQQQKENYIRPSH